MTGIVVLCFGIAICLFLFGYYTKKNMCDYIWCYCIYGCGLYRFAFHFIFFIVVPLNIIFLLYCFCVLYIYIISFFNKKQVENHIFFCWVLYVKNKTCFDVYVVLEGLLVSMGRPFSLSFWLFFCNNNYI